MRLLVSATLAFALVFGASSTAFAKQEPATGRMYGEHISEHAKMGHLGQDMNPGTHQGFSGFEEHHHH